MDLRAEWALQDMLSRHLEPSDWSYEEKSELEADVWGAGADVFPSVTSSGTPFTALLSLLGVPVFPADP